MRSSALDGPVTDRRRRRSTIVRSGQPRRPRKRARNLGYGLVLLLALAGVVMIAAGRGPATVEPSASAGSGTIDFTVFSPPTLERVSYSYRAGSLTLGTPQVIARLPGADGVAYTPSGDLLVGGQGTGQVFVIPSTGGQPTSVRTGTSDAFLETVSPSGNDLYTGGPPGALSVTPLHPLSQGHAVRLIGDDQNIFALAFGPGGQVLYTASNPGETGGNLGLLDLQTGHTHRLLTDVVGAHGIMFDQYSDTYLAIGGNSVLQLSPSNPSQIVSEFTLPGMHFDQGAVTGHGLAFFASNTGYLVTVDYSSTRRIGDLHNAIQSRFLVKNLDDVAPLVGPGARPVTTDAPVLRRAGTISLGAAAVVLIALIVQGGHLPKPPKKSRRRLPRWDRRRKSAGTLNGPRDLLMAPIASVTKEGWP